MANTAEIHIKLTGTNSRTIEKRAIALNRLTGSVARLSKVAKQFPSVSTAANNFARGVQNAGGATEQMGKKVQTAGNYLDNFGNLFSRMVRIMAGFTIITTVTSALTALVRVLFQAPAQLELWNKQLTTLAGSANIAAEKLRLLQDVAIETPLELPDLFQGLNTLKAFNVEIEERTLKLITDLAAVSGRTFQDVSEVVGKVIQGSATAITRSLPTLGINTQEFRELASEIGRSAALFQIIEERFKNFASESANTTIGIVSNIKDAIFVIAADVGQGLLTAIRPAVEGVFEFLQNLRDDEDTLQRYRDTLFDVGQDLVAITRGLAALTRALLDLRPIVKEVLDALGGLKSVIAFLVARRVTAALSGLAGPLKAIAGLNLARKFAALSRLFQRGGAFFTFVSVLLPRALTLLKAISPQARILGLAFTAAFVGTRQLLGGVNEELEDVGDTASLTAAKIKSVFESLDSEVAIDDAFEVRSVLEGFQRRLSGAAGQAGEVAVRGPASLLGPLIEELGRDFGASPVANLLDTASIRLAKGEIEATIQVLQNFIDYQREAINQGITDAQQRVTTVEEAFVPATGIVAASTEETIEANIAQFREFFDFLQLRREFDLVETEEYRRGVSTLLSAIPTEIEAAFAKTDITDSVKTRVVRLLQELLTEVDQAQTDLLLQTAEITERVQQAVAIPAMDGAITAASPDEIMRNIRATQAGFAEQIETDFANLEVDFGLGLIDDSSFNVARQALIDRIDALMAGTSDKEFLLELKQLKLDVEGLEDQISNPLESALRNAAKQAADAFSEVLGALISRPEGANLGDIFKRSIAGILNSMGDALIQAGIASEAFNALIASFGLPGAGLAAIAIGIGLKAFASAIGNSVRSQATTGGSAASGVSAFSGTTTGPIDFGTIAPQPSSVINLNINTIDAAGVSQFVKNNAEELGNAVVYVADRDRATAGEAFGVFTPAFGG